MNNQHICPSLAPTTSSLPASPSVLSLVSPSVLSPTLSPIALDSSPDLVPVSSLVSSPVLSSPSPSTSSLHDEFDEIIDNVFCLGGFLNNKDLPRYIKIIRDIVVTIFFPVLIVWWLIALIWLIFYYYCKNDDDDGNDNNNNSSSV